MRGPLVCETRNAIKENEALLREIDRTQTVNREIINRSAQVSPVQERPISPLSEAERAYKEYASTNLSTQAFKIRPSTLKLEQPESTTGMSSNDLN
jgi:hypothetical protein